MDEMIQITNTLINACFRLLLSINTDHTVDAVVDPSHCHRSWRFLRIRRLDQRTCRYHTDTGQGCMWAAWECYRLHCLHQTGLDSQTFHYTVYPGQCTDVNEHMQTASCCHTRNTLQNNTKQIKAHPTIV